MPTRIVGRDGAWRAIERLLEGAATGPRVLVMEGPPGIGKSSIWREALAGSEERGFRKLVSAPAETEQGLPYTGLHDLLGGIPDTDIAALPEPQARALRAALYRSDPSEGTADAAAVAIAASRLLQRLAERKFRRPWIAAPADERTGYRWLRMADGSYRGMTADEAEGRIQLPPGARIYKPDNLTSQRPPGDFPVNVTGRIFRPTRSYWKTGETGMQRLIAAGRIHVARDSIQYVRYADDFPFVTPTNIWTDTGTGNFTEDKVYVVQTATKVIERCLLMTTDPGDLVLDPTCGSGTTAYVAEQWGRRWITVDTSRVALALARSRLMAAKYPYYLLADSEAGTRQEAKLTGVAPPSPMPPTNNDVRRGFVYERVPHVTLKSSPRTPRSERGCCVRTSTPPSPAAPRRRRCSTVRTKTGASSVYRGRSRSRACRHIAFSWTVPRTSPPMSRRHRSMPGSSSPRSSTTSVAPASRTPSAPSGSSSRASTRTRASTSRGGRVHGGRACEDRRHRHRA
jgi:hypothetical protein